jgi:ribosome biogenesis GTPase
VRTATGDIRGKVPGKLLHDAVERSELPAVGDWVALEQVGSDDAIIRGILPRRSKFSRKVAHFSTEEQIVATNIDFIFVVTSLNSDVNLRRIERYLTMAWEGGASPVLLLTKADLAEDVAGTMADVESVAPGVPVHVTSSIDGTGIQELAEYFSGGRTAALLGSSGTGKSTLINVLIGEDTQKVQDIREDDKGRHTTTYRELIVLPSGGVVIDTPGMREIQLWDADEGLDGAFNDIAELAAGCRFRDCSHQKEPGCAVQAAATDGTLLPERFESYMKLQRELAHLARRQDQRASSANKRQYKVLTRAMRKQMGSPDRFG